MPVATAALPAVPAGFTGRDEDLARLFPVLDPAAESELPVVICAVSGLGGIGAVGDRWREAMAWNNLGATLGDTGRVEKAVEAFEKALERYREFDDWYETGRTLSNLAHSHQYAARPAKARTHYLQSVDAYTRANAPTEAAAAQSRADSLT
ncbi:tetratricopeptide repeat protein [Streptomyces sp. NPDC051642]|uniref:tetratricopeptide repeat protein n=1 Tax=Streptomyces sp. NPDC051642 TaxID=3154646 RepID=UPI0034301210